MSNTNNTFNIKKLVLNIGVENGGADVASAIPRIFEFILSRAADDAAGDAASGGNVSVPTAPAAAPSCVDVSGSESIPATGTDAPTPSNNDLVMGSSATNEAKARWALGRFSCDGDTELHPNNEGDDAQVVAVILAGGETRETSRYDSSCPHYQYRTLYREAGGYAKFGTRTFGSSREVFRLRDTQNNPDFIGVAVLENV